VPDPASQRGPGGVDLRGDASPRLLVLGVRLQNELSHAFLRRGVSDRAQQRKAAAIAIDDVLACGERHVATTATASFPYGEADKLQAFEHAVGEVQLGIREFAGRVSDGIGS